MTRKALLITLAAAAALAGCDNKSHTIVGGPDGDEAANTTKNAPVALPPSIVGSHQYRCKDNSLVSIDWLSDGSATVTTKPGASPTAVAAGSQDLKGDANAKAVTYKGQTCNR